MRYIVVQKVSAGVNLQYDGIMEKRKWKPSDDSNISTRQLLRGGEEGAGRPSASHSKNNIHSAGIKAGPQHNTHKTHTHTHTKGLRQADGNKHKTLPFQECYFDPLRRRDRGRGESACLSFGFCCEVSLHLSIKWLLREKYPENPSVKLVHHRVFINHRFSCFIKERKGSPLAVTETLIDIKNWY